MEPYRYEETGDSRVFIVHQKQREYNKAENVTRRKEKVKQ